MPRPLERWHVMPHGKLAEIAPGIMTVVGEIRMPLGSFPRRMTVVRLRDARLVVFSAIALDDAEMARLEAFGRPAFLVVPNDHHRIDARPWKDRYPNMRVVAPAGGRTKIEDVVHVDTTSPDFGDPDVEFVNVAGTRDREAALIVRTSNGTTLVLNDLIGNVAASRGFSGFMFRLAGFAGDAPRIPRVVKMALVKDAKILAAQLLQWAEIASLNRILVAHGDPIEKAPRQALRELAGSLA